MEKGKDHVADVGEWFAIETVSSIVRGVSAVRENYPIRSFTLTRLRKAF